eukprot:CAMPEP_0198155190 /NCGR_PEP_ID=MMETSP1443-20131203/69008_1 /TAXON_ID=186043 /ORGANISM="Entomoneis sp., Strain CCMP2396" /LENGTH=47 /DNA_ID= /DNA_START= /DNA_END= /DNA_ORIENTATION=
MAYPTTAESTAAAAAIVTKTPILNCRPSGVDEQELLEDVESGDDDGV